MLLLPSSQYLVRTLDDHINGCVQHGNTPGADTVLTAEEEAGLESYLLHLAGCGFPLTHTIVKAFAWPKPNALAEATGSTPWIKDFLTTDLIQDFLTAARVRMRQ